MMLFTCNQASSTWATRVLFAQTPDEPGAHDSSCLDHKVSNTPRSQRNDFNLADKLQCSKECTLKDEGSACSETLQQHVLSHVEKPVWLRLLTLNRVCLRTTSTIPPTAPTEPFTACACRKGRGSFGAQVMKTVPDNVGVLQFLQQGHLPDGRAWNPLLLTLQADLLHRHHLPRGLVSALVNHAIGTCNTYTGHLIHQQV